MSPIFENAVDSLRIGMQFLQKESGYSSRKHAVLTVFYAIELLLKEQLHRTNPVLIHKNIDTKICEDSHTVGLDDAKEQQKAAGVYEGPDMGACGFDDFLHGHECFQHLSSLSRRPDSGANRRYRQGTGGSNEASKRAAT
jgi:hypothetical protein